MMRTLAVLMLLSRLAAANDEELLYNCKKKPAGVRITLKPEIEVKELVTWAVGFTCKQIVYDPRIISAARKVTVIAPETQTADEAYELFVTALGTIGYTVVPKGKTLRIVESPSAIGDTVPMLHDGKPTGDSVVRYIVRPKAAPVATMQQAFAALKSKDGNVTVVGSLIVITDYASNVRDMLSLGKLVDVAGGSDGLYTIPVKHADAGKLAEKLTALLKSDKPDAVPLKLLADDRTNTLVVGGTAASYERVHALVERLDLELDTDGGQTMHVYQLGSAIAEEVAKTVNEAIQTPAKTTGDKGALAIEGQAKVISDKATNKLIVMSSGRDFLAIREVIRALDVPRRQVYIEATIVEVQVGNDLQIGASMHGGKNVDNGKSLLLGATQMPKLSSLRATTQTEAGSAIAGSSGLIAGVVGKALGGSLLGQSIPSFAVLFQALATNGTTNVLSSPSILVLDNEEAKFKVGSNVPYAKGVMPTSPTASSSLTTNIDRKDLLLELNIKPHISDNDSVLLEVYQSSEDLGEPNEALGPTWTTRAFTTRVLVNDQQTIVMSGMMQEREIRDVTKVPLLGDIPILGYLFKYTTRNKKKTNLLVMLTPYIIKDQLDLEAIRERKERDHDEFVGSVHALDGMKFRPRIDYRRKRGLIEEINRVVLSVDEDAAARAKLHERPQVAPGLVE